MAGLHLPPPLPVGVMLPHDKTKAPGLRSSKQDPYEGGDSPQLSSAGHLRDSPQEKLLSSQELTLSHLYPHPKRNPCEKAGSSSYPHRAGLGQQDPKSHLQGQAKDLFYSPGPQARHPKASHHDFLPFTKKRVGVDRAYPLKPVFHRKSHSTGEAGLEGGQHVSPGPPAPRESSHSGLGVRNWASSSGVGTVVAGQGERPVANPTRAEWMQIRRLEAAGENLEEEIRRKETLLRAKLKKTEEELRRIRKEKEQAEDNENRELQRLTLPRRRLKGYSNTPYRPVFSPEDGTLEVFGLI